MVREIPADAVKTLYVAESMTDKFADICNQIPAEVEIVRDSVFQSMSDTNTPQGILAEVYQTATTEDDLFAGDAGPVKSWYHYTNRRGCWGDGYYPECRYGRHLQPEGDPFYDGIDLPDANCRSRGSGSDDRSRENTWNPGLWGASGWGNLLGERFYRWLCISDRKRRKWSVR